MEDAQLLRAVNELLALYGEDAARQAVARADKLLERGDLEGCEFWRKIAQAIVEPRR
jgi:hypothetical protein